MDEICAIIVSYNPGPSIIDNVVALLPQVQEIVIIDNDSEQSSKHYLEELVKAHNIQVIYNKSNLGIATALNIGAQYAIHAGYPWIATFDQDSLATEDFIVTMVTAYEGCANKDRVAIVSPVYYDQATGVVASFARQRVNDLLSYVDTTMTSGNLVRTEVFAVVGFFDDEFFIDYVDNEFCLRLVNRGFLLIEANEAKLLHNLGVMSQHFFMGKLIQTTNHHSLRRYYIARNRMVVYKRYLTCSLRWVLKDIVAFAKEVVKIMIFEKKRKSKILYIIKGICHGLLGRMGKYE